MPRSRACQHAAPPRRIRLTDNRARDTRRAQGGQHARPERRAQPRMVGQQAERWRAEPERHVEEGGIGPHGEPAIFRRHQPDGFDPEAGIDQRIAEPGERRSGQRQRQPGREPDQRETRGFDQHADQRDLGAGKPVPQVAKQKSRRNEGQREDREGEPRRPSARDEQQRAECGDRAEADAAQRRSEAGSPDRGHDLDEARAHARGARSTAQRRDPHERRQRQQRGRERNRGKAVARIERAADRRACGERCKHRAADPRQRLAGVANRERRQRPALRAGDDEALAHAEQRPAEQQDRRRDRWSRDEAERHEVEEPGAGGDRQARDDGVLGAARVGMAAGPHAREDRGGKLAAGHETHQEGAETKSLVHMQRQHRQRDPDHEKSDEHRRHDRQQRRERGSKRGILPSRPLGAAYALGLLPLPTWGEGWGEGVTGGQPHQIFAVMIFDSGHRQRSPGCSRLPFEAQGAVTARKSGDRNEPCYMRRRAMRLGGGIGMDL